MKRDFSEEEKQKLLDYIKQDNEKNDRRFLGDFIDFFADEINYGGLDISDYVNDIDAYHRKLVDKEDYAYSDINSLFEAVYTVDSTYKGKLEQQLQLLEEYNNTITELESIITINETDSKNSNIFLESSQFATQISGIGNGAIDYYLSKYVTINSYGVREINWSEIENFFNGDVNEISAMEYAAIMQLLDTFIVDKDGKPALDIDKMERFIECAYSYETDSFTSGGTGYISNIATLSPVFTKLTSYQEIRAELLLDNFGYCFYNDEYDEYMEEYINTELMKTGIMSASVENLNMVTQSIMTTTLTNREEINAVYNWEIDITITEKENDGVSPYYFLNVADGLIQDSVYEGAEIHGFSTTFNAVAHDEKIKLTSSLQIDIKDKIKTDIEAQVVNMTIGSFTQNLEEKLKGNCPAIGTFIEIETFTVSEAIEISEAEQQNNTVSQLLYIEDVQYYADALSIGGCVNTFNGDMQVNFQYCNEEKLLLKIEAYNTNKNKTLDIDTLIEDYNKVISGGEASAELIQFSAWVNKRYPD